MRLVLATRNAHKAREFAALLRPAQRRWRCPAEVELPPEDGDDVRRQRAGQGPRGRGGDGAGIADDSGIASEALGGAPGVRSARFAGEDATDEENLAKLLREAPEGSAVAYVCAIALVDPAAARRVFEGRCTGRLAAAPRGTGGFGYDPAFVPDDLDGRRTMAELAPEEKDAISTVAARRGCCSSIWAAPRTDRDAGHGPRTGRQADPPTRG